MTEPEKPQKLECNECTGPKWWHRLVELAVTTLLLMATLALVNWLNPAPGSATHKATELVSTTLVAWFISQITTGIYSRKPK